MTVVVAAAVPRRLHRLRRLRRPVRRSVRRPVYRSARRPVRPASAGASRFVWHYGGLVRAGAVDRGVEGWQGGDG